MARESKAKRDARRFGRPERLADLFGMGNWAVGDDVPPEAFRHEFVDKMRRHVAHAIGGVVIEATNVFDYCNSLDGVKQLRFREDIVNAVPPFEDCFVEFRVDSSLSPQIRHAGWAISSYVKGEESQAVYDALMSVPCPDAYAAAKWFLVGTFTLGMYLSPDSNVMGVMCPVAQAVVLLGENGNALLPPLLSIPEPLVPGCADWAQLWAHATFFSATFTFCFMNCKNVTVQPHDPDPAINRERRKAQLKPFVRYHTINIDPMKQVLRTEGGVESNGLKKALHICRGHFATYTTSLMGRTLDKPVTVWKPAHVRGSAKHGVVVSDYSVKAPEEPRP